MLSADEKARFDAKVDRTGSCHVWTAGSSSGYGKFWLHGKYERAHRVAYTHEVGEIPDGLCVLHSCDNPACVNVEHLRVGTHTENMEDKVRRERCGMQKGEGHHNAKLIRKQVLQVRCLLQWGFIHRDIANLFEVSQAAVGDIHTGRSWRHL